MDERNQRIEAGKTLLYPWSESETSDLGALVVDFLDRWYGGFHNIARQINLHQIDWTNNHYIAVRYQGRNLATFDFGLLTKLVVLAHDAMIRIEINPMSRVSVELVFHERKKREGSAWERMPTIEDHIKMIRPLK